MRIKTENGNASITTVTKPNPFSEIIRHLMTLRPQAQKIRVYREDAFPPLSTKALAVKLQHEWGKQPGVIHVELGDNARSPESYLVWVEME
jgi:hypothetical protein